MRREERDEEGGKGLGGREGMRREGRDEEGGKGLGGKEGMRRMSNTTAHKYAHTYHDALSVFSSTPRCNMTLNFSVRGKGTFAVISCGSKDILQSSPPPHRCHHILPINPSPPHTQYDLTGYKPSKREVDPSTNQNHW